MPRPRRFAAVGGLAAWRALGVFGALSLGAAVHGAWEVAAALAVTGVALDALDRAVVLEVAGPGLVRAFTVGGAVVAPVRVIPWSEVDEIATRWQHPRDHTGLETVVTGATRDEIAFGTKMGLAAYTELLAEIARRAPHARRTGLTEELLAQRAGLRRAS